MQEKKKIDQAEISACGVEPSGYIHPDNARRLLDGETVAFRKKPYGHDGGGIPVFVGTFPVSAEPVAVPEGWKLVPVQPTEEMLVNVDEEVGGSCHSCSAWRASEDDCKRVWAAMIEASPIAPVAAQAQPDLIRFDYVNADGQPDSKMITHDEMRERYATLAQQPVSGADGRRDPDGYVLIEVETGKPHGITSFYGADGCKDHADHAANKSNGQYKVAPVFIGSHESDPLPDATKMVPGDQFRDAAQMIEPSGNSGELPPIPEGTCATEVGGSEHNPKIYFESDMRDYARAALAQQDALQAEVLDMVRMLETNEWADHCGQSELGKRLEWAITALQNRIAELTKPSSQQDVDKVDADRYRWLRDKRTREELQIVLCDEGVELDAAIDAARKEPGQ